MAEKHIVVYVARHGTTTLNAQGAFRGPIDAPLDSAGTRDAHKLGFYFEPVELSLIAHSDRKRTRSTAEIIAQQKHIPYEKLLENPGLRAWDVGDLGGKPKNAENLEIVRFHVQHPDVPMPGGESMNHFRARVRPILRDAIELGLRYGVPPLLVAHSSIVHEVGVVVAENHNHTLVEPGGVCAIFIANGRLDAEPIFKPKSATDPDVVT